MVDEFHSNFEKPAPKEGFAEGAPHLQNWFTSSAVAAARRTLVTLLRLRSANAHAVMRLKTEKEVKAAIEEIAKWNATRDLKAP